jgi:hypothetical protein
MGTRARAEAWRQGFKDAVTEDDRDHLRQAGVDLNACTPSKFPAPPWSIFKVAGCPAVLDGCGSMIMLSPN